MFLKIRSVSRGRKESAVAKAAYIARDKLRDARTGVTHDYRRTGNLDHAAILSPSGTPPASHEWTQSRVTLWNSAEAAENRRDARVAREYTIALPHELSADDRRQLARQFAQSIADRYHAVVDLAVHGPTPHGDVRNHHAHVLATTRELRGNGFGAKTSMELSTACRHARGLPHTAVEYRTLRAQWAELANEKLREAHLEVRLEARSRAALEQEELAVNRPANATPPVLDARLEAAPVHAASAVPGTSTAAPATSASRDVPAMAVDRQLAADRWLAYRTEAASIRPREATRGRDHGLDLGAEL